MTFREGGQFEGGRVRKTSGARGGGVAVGGGAGLLIILFLVAQLTGIDLSGVLGGGGGGQSQDLGTVEECTAQQANTDAECRLSATLQSLDAFWEAEAPKIGLSGFQIPDAEAFASSTRTGCGNATSAVGPFYCPPDQGIYLDLGFFDVMRDQFGASGNLAEMYVVAHEYGHHIQNLTGYFDRADRSGTGADSDSVRLELQADCLAGMWANHAASIPDPDTGVIFLEPISASELRDALGAAEAVGDDRIQESSGGSINPDSWTHGSSEQRQKWFMIGYEQGNFAACDTFEASSL